MHAPLADPLTGTVALLRPRVGLGDLLCTVPALRMLRRARPDVRVLLITWPETAPIVDRMRAYVDALVPFPGYPGIPERTPDRAALPRFLDAMARRGIDLALQDYGDNPAANAVCERLGARRTGGFVPTAWPVPRDTGAFLRYPTHVHEIRRHLLLLEHLGVAVPPGAAALEFPERPDDRAAWAALAEELDLRPGEYVVVHPGATSPSRRWPPERFARLADTIAGRGFRVVLSGTRGETDVTGAVRDRMRMPAADVTGRCTLGAFAVLLRAAALLVGNDTGPAHLAAAVGAPSVTVFLSGDPARWAYDDARHRVARTQVECNPCGHLDCPIDFRCATSLPVGAVLEQVDALLPHGIN